MAISPFSTPQKRYPAHLNGDGNISFVIRSPSKKARYVVYDICSTSETDGKIHYLGLTTQTFGKRMAQHACAAKKSPDAFHTALRESPLQFSAAIVAQFPSEEDLVKGERALIDSAKKTHQLYNEREGGAGIRKQREKKENPPLPTIHQTPEKYYPIERGANGKLQVKWTPNGKSVENGIYVLKNHDTDQRYVGASINPSKRLSSHLSLANNSNRSHPLYGDLQSSPDETFGVGILAKDLDPNELDEQERHFIRIKGSQKNGYNQNQGGGGLSKFAPIRQKLQFSDQSGN